MRDRTKMTLAKALKAKAEFMSPEELAAEPKLADPHEEGKAHDKIRDFMYKLRSDVHIWTFEME